MSSYYESTLRKILKHAAKLGRDGVLTVECFVAAACEYIHGDIEEPDERYVAAMTEMIEWQETTVPALHSALLSYIRSHKPDYNDGKCIQKALSDVTIANNDSSEDITPPELLRLVLNDPTEGLKKCLQAKSGRETWESEGDRDASFIPEGMAPKDALERITQEVRDIREALLSAVFGQDNAVNVFVSGIFQAKLDGLTKPDRVQPCATFLFAGPPGVGKTYLAQQAAKALKLPFARFDMSEYSHHEASIEFIGSDAVYRNSHEGNFTRFVKEHPRCVVLFDEVEKAHAVVTNLFLQMLDGGFIRDGHTDEELPLKDVLMIFTTNAGRQLYEDSESGDFSMLSRKVVLNALRKDVNPLNGVPYFPSAICSRFASGNVVMFNRIDAADLNLIALRELNRSAVNFIDETGIQVTISSKVGSALLFAEGGAADA